MENNFNNSYEAGFSTDLEYSSMEPGISESKIRELSLLREEPEWLLAWRLRAFELWSKMEKPGWIDGHAPDVDMGAVSLRAAPKAKLSSLDEADPKMLEMFEKLGVPLGERAALAGVAVDAILDSVSVGTSFKAALNEKGIIFCSFGEAVREHPELVRAYLGSVVPAADNYYSALNSAAFSDGSFAYIPEGVACPMELSTYFRINAKNSGQFERTLIIAEARSSVSYLEGCTAAAKAENQLHAAVVEIVALEDASVKYSTVQNWYPGDADGNGGVLNYVTKRGDCRGARSKISWTQVETGSAVTWKYPSVLLRGEDSVGEFFSVSVSSGRQLADTGTKMIHIGKGTRSTILSKGISAQRGRNVYRGAVRMLPGALGAVNSTKCDNLIFGDEASSVAYPSTDIAAAGAHLEHEASISKISDEAMHFAMSRGFDEAEAVSLIVGGFCKDVFSQLPMEFAVEAQKLISYVLEGARS